MDILNQAYLNKTIYETNRIFSLFFSLLEPLESSLNQKKILFLYKTFEKNSNLIESLTKELFFYGNLTQKTFFEVKKIFNQTEIDLNFQSFFDFSTESLKKLPKNLWLRFILRSFFSGPVKVNFSFSDRIDAVKDLKKFDLSEIDLFIFSMFAARLVILDSQKSLIRIFTAFEFKEIDLNKFLFETEKLCYFFFSSSINFFLKNSRLFQLTWKLLAKKDFSIYKKYQEAIDIGLLWPVLISDKTITILLRGLFFRYV